MRMANASEWRKRVAAWRASGLSAEQFCAGHRVYDGEPVALVEPAGPEGKTGRGRRPSPIASEPPVAVARLVRAGEGSPSGSVVVELNGARIEVRGAVPAATLRAVFEVLREGAL